jgi:protein gp37
MSENTKIEWATHTFNPWEGCQKVGPGCDHCYAESRNARFARGTAINWGPGAPRRRTSQANWAKPRAWNANHEAFFAEHGHRQRVFCASLADVFDNQVPDQWRHDLWELIWATPNLDWLLLTKRIGNVNAMLPEEWGNGMIDHWPHVWIGATIVNQEEADRDIPNLLAVPAAKRFLSIEPLLGSVALPKFCACGCMMPIKQAIREAVNGPSALNEDQADAAIKKTLGVDWVIVGGESGPGARPMHPDWARSLRDQCEAAGVPFLFKQWGEWLPGQNDMHVIGHKVAHHQDGSWGRTKTMPTPQNYVSWDVSGCMHFGNLINKPLSFRAEAWAERVGKKAAGRLLDSRTWDGFPS